MDVNTNNVTKLDINFLEYCIIAEDTYLPAETVKVYIPKLTTSKSKGKSYNIACELESVNFLLERILKEYDTETK